MNKLSAYILEIEKAIGGYKFLVETTKTYSEAQLDHAKMVLGTMCSSLELLKGGNWAAYSASVDKVMNQRIDATYTQPQVARKAAELLFRVRMLHGIGRL